MIKGLDVFKEFFGGFQDQYVLIGGAACDLLLFLAVTSNPDEYAPFP